MPDPEDAITNRDICNAVTSVGDDRALLSLRLLSSAGHILASSPDYAATLPRVAELVVPAFADGFAVELVESGFLRTVVTEGSTAGRDTAFALVAEDREVGLMRIWGRDDAETFDLEVLAELAARIAVSVAAAQRLAREHHVADTLQRALLPDRLPESADVRLHAAYLPGAAEAIVGGDWYDAFPLSDGSIAVSIGDVAGHGLRAAIVMGEVRQAFRAAAIEARSPADVLERANAIVNLRDRPVMVTAAFGVFEPLTGVLHYATAGHPPPILVLADGAARVLPSEGVPLGIADRVGASNWTITIPPGALVTFYTDGIVEYTRDVIEGEARLLSALDAMIAEHPADPARALVQRVFGRGENTDDVAVLTLARADVPQRTFAFDFTGIPAVVPIVRRALTRYASQVQLDEDASFALITSVGEAVANAVEHGYVEVPGVVRVRAGYADGLLHASVEDQGRWRPAQRREERGRGVPLMRALMDGVEIRTEPSRTCVSLRKRVG